MDEAKLFSFETPENYKKNIMTSGHYLLNKLFASAKHIKLITAKGIFEDLSAVSNNKKLNPAELKNLVNKLEQSNYDYGEEILFDQLSQKFSNTYFEANNVEDLLQEIINKDLVKQDVLKQIELEAKANIAINRFTDAQNDLTDRRIASLIKLASKDDDDNKFKENRDLLAGYYDAAFRQYNGSLNSAESFDKMPSHFYDMDNPQDANHVSFGYDETEKLPFMEVENLRGTNLSFRLFANSGKDGNTFLSLNDNQSEMTVQQIEELARFLFKSGAIQNPDLIAIPSDIKVIRGIDKSFREIFNAAFEAEIRAQQKIENKENIENSNKKKVATGNCGGVSERNYPNNNKNEYHDYLNDDKKATPDMDKMRSEMEKRAGILGIQENLLSWRRNLDGSMSLVAYKTEADRDSDAYIDKKKSTQARKKFFAMNVRVGPPPSVSVYVPPGAKIESGHAKMILSAIKSQGCKYFTPAPGPKFSGSGNGSMWEAAGSMGMCPKLKCSDSDDGYDGFSNDNLRDMLKKIGDEDKLSYAEVLRWKMRLVSEIKGYVQYKGEIKEARLKTAAACLEGDIKFSRFTASHQADIENYIMSNCRQDDENSWTTLDMTCVVMATEELLYAIANGKDRDGNKFEYNYIQQDPKKLIEFIENKKKKNSRKVEELFKEQCAAESHASKHADDPETQGSVYERAAGKVLRRAQDNLNAYIAGDLVANYGDAAKIRFNFPSANPPKPKSKEESNYHLPNNGKSR